MLVYSGCRVRVGCCWAQIAERQAKCFSAASALDPSAVHEYAWSTNFVSKGKP